MKNKKNSIIKKVLNKYYYDHHNVYTTSLLRIDVLLFISN